ncbi:hypothetical protein BCR42DRAFT_421705 [Absidia repens]|uniref:F-box domain-containing protein n=1 Tax=Absidia repens TaxID=90262 RepID=A0A1X2I7T0_9FUNG|nr:hypothetical protein BCR42DRAFT_421705 [Absidia repens]
MNNFGSLPFEILSLILKQVDQQDIYTCAFVNQHCHRAAIPLLWRTLSVPDAETADIITDLFESSSSSSPTLLGHHVRHLDFRFFAVTDRLLLRWMPHLPQVTTLTIFSGGAITDTSFQHLPRHCPRLQYLCLRYSLITQLSFRALGQHCLQLRVLHLHECSGVDNTTLSKDALQRCPLENIALGANDPLHLSNVTTMIGLTSYDLLTNLSLTYVSTPVVKQLLLMTTTTNNDCTTSVWPHLTYLTVSSCADLGSDDTLSWFLQRHPTLRYVSLVRVDLTDLTLDAIAASLHHVTRVNISRNQGITHHGIRRMVHQCRALTSVSLYGCAQTEVDFPEVEPECIEPAIFHRQEPHRYIHKLDQEAINTIRTSRS